MKLQLVFPLLVLYSEGVYTKPGKLDRSGLSRTSNHGDLVLGARLLQTRITGSAVSPLRNGCFTAFQHITALQKYYCSH